MALGSTPGKDVRIPSTPGGTLLPRQDGFANTVAVIRVVIEKILRTEKLTRKRLEKLMEQLLTAERNHQVEARQNWFDTDVVRVNIRHMVKAMGFWPECVDETDDSWGWNSQEDGGMPNDEF